METDITPREFPEFLTLGDCAREPGVSPSWINTLNQRGVLPDTVRTRSGMRLFLPEAVAVAAVAQARAQRREAIA